LSHVGTYVYRGSVQALAAMEHVLSTQQTANQSLPTIDVGPPPPAAESAEAA